MPTTKAVITVQDFMFPCAFVNALSYAKTSRVVTDWRGESRFRGYERGEISLRLAISPAICEAVGEDFVGWVEAFDSITPQKASVPTVFAFNGYPLNGSLLYALTSVNRSQATDGLGVYQYELDLVFSGVSACKEKVRDRALIFAQDERNTSLPILTLTCGEKSLEVKENTSISELTLTEKGCSATIFIGEGLKNVPRDWMTRLVENQGTIQVDGYSKFFITSASIVDDELRITGSCFDISYNKFDQFTLFNKTISNIFSDFTTSKEVDFTTNYLFYSGTKKELLEKIQESSGFLIDYYNKKILPVPDSINSDFIFSFYYDDDLKTEPITGLSWYDSVNKFDVGSSTGAVREVKSVYHSQSSSPADSCFKWAKLMQNEIIIEAPIDPRIRQFSCFNISKNNTQIPVMVTSFELDFISDTMKLTVNYL